MTPPDAEVFELQSSLNESVVSKQVLQEKDLEQLIDAVFELKAELKDFKAEMRQNFSGVNSELRVINNNIITMNANISMLIKEIRRDKLISAAKKEEM